MYVYVKVLYMEVHSLKGDLGFTTFSC